MKQIFPLLFFCFACFITSAQDPSSNSLTSNKKTFIEYNIEELTADLTASMSKWEEKMIFNGYAKLDESEGIIIYTKEDGDEQIHAIAKNEIGVISVDWWDYKDKERLYDKVESGLKGKFLGNTQGINYYGYKKYLVGFEQEEYPDYIVDRVFIKLK